MGSLFFGFFVCVGLLIVLIQNVSLLTLCAGVCLFLFAMMLLQESFKILSGGVLDVFLDKVANTNYKSFLFGFTVSSFGTVQRAGYGYSDFFLECGINGLTVRHCHGLRHQFIYRRFCFWLVGYFGLKRRFLLYAMPLIIFGLGFFYQ